MNTEEVKMALIDAGEKDQAILAELSSNEDSPELLEKLNKIDKKNQILIRKLVSELGLITVSKYGKEASKYAFLLVLHLGADNLIFMESYLEKMKANLNDVSPEHFALLQDKVLIYSGKMQLYGTQVFLNEETSRYECRPCEDPDNLNSRRKQLGLTTIEEYLE